MNTQLLTGRLALRAAFAGLLVLTHSLPAVAQTFRAQEFEAEIDQYARRYADLAETSDLQRMLTSGDIDAYNERLTLDVPDSDKTFYDYFVLANLLFSEEREQSFQYMLNAEEIQPSNPYVWYERGIHEHRLGNCEGAIKYYRRLHNEQAGHANPVSWAYRTHCALRIGEYIEAVQAWQRAEFSRHHTSIEKGMYALFSDARPHTIRQQIITQISSGEHEAFCDLLHHDRNWEIDWWNQTMHEDFLAFDVALANSTIAEGSDDTAIIRLCMNAPELSDREFEAALRDAGVWGEDASAPDSEALIYDIALRLTSGGLADPADVIAILGAQLWQRFVDGNVGRRLLEVMGFLYSSTGDLARLREIDDFGWHELRLERFTASYLLGTDPTDDSYAQLLEEAQADFPNSATISGLALSSAASGPDRIETIANYVATEFANVKENWTGPYRLNDFMASFQREVDPPTQ